MLKILLRNRIFYACNSIARKFSRAKMFYPEIYVAGLMPILVFYMNDGPMTRRIRRSTGCPEGSPSCCGVRSLEINFRSIGWDYIMAPTKIMANYCAGPCNGISFLL